MTAKHFVLFQQSQINAIKKDYIGYVLHLSPDQRPVSLNNFTLNWIENNAKSFRTNYNKKYNLDP